MSITIALPLGYKPVLKHGDHDQSSHGAWATGGEGSSNQTSEYPTKQSNPELANILKEGIT